MRVSWSALFIIFTFACMSTKSFYKYANGSADVYTLTGTILEYDPVQPEESSTGTYSGGDPKTVTLTTSQADSLRALMDQAFNHTAVHIPDRVKGSGRVSIGSGKQSKHCILAQGCEDIKIIEDALKKSLK
jgi:hypothetical protein